MKSHIGTILGLTFLAACCLFAPGSFAVEPGYYKWIDEKGRPHHSDRPPPAGTAYEFITSDGGIRRQISVEEAKSSPVPKVPATTQPKEPISEEAGAIVKNSGYCDTAKSNLDTLNSKARVRIRDADDNIRFLTEDEKEAQRQKARDLISVHCN